MFKNAKIELPDYVHFQVIEDNVFIFIDKTSETLCFSNDTLWLLETLKSNAFCLDFSDLVAKAQLTFTGEILPDIQQFLTDQIQELHQLRILIITH